MKIDLWKIVIGGMILVVGVALGMIVLTLRNREVPAPIEIRPPEPTSTALPTITPAPILVYISGEVLVPDVYTLAPESRIKQLVEAAGGFTDDADTVAVNLAQPLTDGAHVHIPTEGELVSTPPSVLSTPFAQRGSTEIDLGSGGDLVNINAANLQELDTLPGIGPVTAQNILDYRAVNGPFTNIEAITEVFGIGQAKFDKIKELITTGN
jgi:competence protein ComEA